MIFDLKKLATIENATLELRPFTVVIGPNNSNKTYMAYSIYALLDTMVSTWSQFKLYYSQPNPGSVNFTCDAFFMETVRSSMALASKRTIAELAEFFQDARKSIFTDSNVSIIVSDDEILEAFKTACNSLPIYAQPGTLAIPEANEPASSRTFTLIDARNLEDPTPANQRPFPSRPEDIVSVFSFLFVRALAPTPFVLPAERNALILTAPTLLGQRYRLMKGGRSSFFLNAEQKELFSSKADQVEASFLPKPIEDYLDFLFSLLLEPNRQRALSESAIQFQQLADLLIKQLYDGATLELADVKETGARQIVLRLDAAHSLDLHNASTSIKQLTSLVFYLRYRARIGDLLIIDEPEMNLHPKSQARLVEILAILSTLGVKVLLTTHSPFVMAHLNNLIASAEAKTSDSLFLKDTRARLPMDNVSAYEMKGHCLVSIKDSELGLSWKTFSDVSSDLQTRLFQIYDTLEEPA